MGSSNSDPITQWEDRINLGTFLLWTVSQRYPVERRRTARRTRRYPVLSTLLVVALAAWSWRGCRSYPRLVCPARKLGYVPLLPKRGTGIKEIAEPSSLYPGGSMIVTLTQSLYPLQIYRKQQVQSMDLLYYDRWLFPPGRWSWGYNSRCWLSHSSWQIRSTTELTENKFICPWSRFNTIPGINCLIYWKNLLPSKINIY